MVGGRTNLGPDYGSLVLGRSGPDLGPDLELTWDLDLSLTSMEESWRIGQKEEKIKRMIRDELEY